MEVKSKAQRSFSRSLFKAKHAVLNVVTRENPPNLTNKDFTIEDWGRKITHQQEEGKEFQKQLQKYINALRTLTMERSRLLDLLLCGYPSSWGNKDQLKLSKIEQEAAVENCVSKLNYDTMSKLNKYALMFPEYRNKIARLDRRRTDLDLTKENYEKVKNSKNLNAQKVQRAKLQVDEEQQIYDDMTTQLREELPQVYSSRAGLIGYIFASWMREEMGLHREITKHNEKVENIMVQLQKDHQSGKLRTTVASNTRQNSRELRENEVEFLRADKKYKDLKRSTRSQSIPTNQNHGNHHSGSPSPTSSRENLKPPTRTTSTPQPHRETMAYEESESLHESHSESLENGIQSKPEVINDQPEDFPKSLGIVHEPVQPELMLRSVSDQPTPSSVRSSPSPYNEKNPEIENTKKKKSRSLERERINEKRYQVPTLDQSGMQRLSSRHDDEEEEFAEIAPPPPLVEYVPPIDQNQRSDSEDSLAPDDEEKLKNDTPIDEKTNDGSGFPPLPSDLAIIKTEPGPEKGRIENRTPSPVKIKTTAPSPCGPPPYEEFEDFPPLYQYTVAAVYPYKAADEDELSFAKGEHIYVVQHPQPNEQDEGWLLGIRKSDWNETRELKKRWGLFPANFTKELQ